MTKKDDEIKKRLMRYLDLAVRMKEQGSENMDLVSWKDVEGILIKGTEAKFILELLKDVK